MKIFLGIIFLIFPAFASLPDSAATSGADSLHCRIDATVQKEQLRVQGICRNTSDTERKVDYRLITEKHGQSGVSKSSQSGSVTVPPGEEKVLSRVTLNLFPDDRYVIILEVYENGKLIAREKIVYPPWKKI